MFGKPLTYNIIVLIVLTILAMATGLTVDFTNFLALALGLVGFNGIVIPMFEGRNEVSALQYAISVIYPLAVFNAYTNALVVIIILFANTAIAYFMKTSKASI